MALAALLTPLVGPQVAGATPADLETEDGLAIRIDENALIGPALEAIEDELQGVADSMIYDGAVENTPVGNPNAIYVSSNLELSIDFVNAGSPGYTDGGLKVHADIEDIEIEYRKNAWWHSECGIWVRPDTATIDASARIDQAKLPGAPLTMNPILAHWDTNPGVSSSGLCWTYLIDDWFNDFFGIGDPGSIADSIEDALNAQAQDLIDGLWDDYVMPVVEALNAFGITWGQIRTDDHGLIVTADVDADGGLNIPGMPGGPYFVTDTEDSGADSDVNTLLAARSEVTVSIHPNVVNQFLNALNQGLNSQMGVASLDGPTIEAFLLPEADHDDYYDSGWTIATTVSEAYFTQPANDDGRPQLQLPEVTFTFSHPDFDWGFSPVATFTGSMTGIDLTTDERPGSDNWGPVLSPAGAEVSLDFHPDTWLTAQVVRDHMDDEETEPDDALPFAKQAIDWYNDSLLVPYLSLAPIEIAGIPVDLCTSCARVSGDDRYTEFFTL